MLIFQSGGAAQILAAAMKTIREVLHYSNIDEGDYTHIRVDSLSPLDEHLANADDEQHYRMLLDHDFHPSRRLLLNRTYQPSNDSAVTLPLWSPSTVDISRQEI